MKRLSPLLIFICLSAFCQIPNGYYDDAANKEGNALKEALNDIIKDHKEISYSKAYDALIELDRDPTNSKNVLGIYSGFSMDGRKKYDGGKGWNREHVWAKSKGDFGTTLGAGTDLHHLKAADVSTNSARNNRLFDLCDKQYEDKGGKYNGLTDSKRCTNRWAWEPRDEVKGDVARMIFYMATRYEGEDGEPDLELIDTLLNKSSKDPFHGRVSLLLEWHADDPVSDDERRRNDLIHSKYQGNRNPYIDHPEYVEKIWF